MIGWKALPGCGLVSEDGIGGYGAYAGEYQSEDRETLARGKLRSVS